MAPASGKVRVIAARRTLKLPALEPERARYHTRFSRLTVHRFTATVCPAPLFLP
jgi:hypothetical protein